MIMKMCALSVFSVTLACVGAAQAAQPPTSATRARPAVPALHQGKKSNEPSPPVNLLSGRDSVLTAQQRRTVKLSKAWRTARTAPGRGPQGLVMFRFGASQPTVVCAPLRVCDIELQPGEQVQHIDAGDSVRWLITPALSGQGDEAITHVLVKPTDTDLQTNLVITTDRRTYNIDLVSRHHDWMSGVAFSYPEDEDKQWAALEAAQAKSRRNNVMPESGQNLATLDFNYRISGDDPSWRPVRVYTNGEKTYIQFPRAMKYASSPALLALGGDGGLFSSPTKELVNYRQKGDRYVVDRVLQRAILVSGVGRHQVKVEIDHTGGK